jgi:replication-associated recombination protein RarA
VHRQRKDRNIKSLILFGTGTGKSCTAISIAEKFKEQVKKCNTKIYIL